MCAINYATKRVPCRSIIEELDLAPYAEEKLFTAAGNGTFRVSHNGVLAFPYNSGDRVVFIDREMYQKITEKSFSLKGVPSGVVKNLIDFKVIESFHGQKNSYVTLIAPDVDMPSLARLEITNSCQCNCDICYQKSDRKLPNPDIGTIKKRILHLKEAGVVKFQILGGEPFLSPDIVQICSFIYEHGLAYTIVTNGEFLDRLIENDFDMFKHCGRVYFSLDGFEDEHDNSRQRQGLFSKAVKNLLALHEKGVPVCVETTTSDLTATRLNKLFEFLKLKKIPVDIRSAILANKELEASIKSEKVHIPSEFIQNPLFNSKHIKSQQKIPISKYYGCDQMFLLNIDTQGHLMSCVMDRKSKGVNIDVCSVEGLVQYIKQTTKRMLEMQKGCSECEYNPPQKIMCGGLCRFSKSFKEKLKS